MQIRNLKDLLKIENNCIHLGELQRMYEKLTDPSFINKNDQEQTDYINKYKDKLNLCDQLLQTDQLADDNKNIEFFKRVLAKKQEKLRLYSQINIEPQLFSDPIISINNQEFERNITEGGKSIDNFTYKPPNSASNSAIFNGYYKGKNVILKHLQFLILNVLDMNKEYTNIFKIEMNS